MKNFSMFLCAVLFFSFFNISTQANNDYLPPEEIDLGFDVKINQDGYIEASWNIFEGDLKFYKLIRSQENNNPYYPEDGYIFYSTDKKATTYLDKEALNGKVYYRICAITNQKARLCSAVKTVEKENISEVESLDFCIQVIQSARNPETGECKDFPTPCDVPSGWKAVDSCQNTSLSKIFLTAEKNNNGEILLNWQIEGSAPNGFKIAKSTKNLEPTYPPKDGDSFEYLSNSEARSYTDKLIKSGKTYYYRVCVYESNGQCNYYSNSVSIKIPEIVKNDNQYNFSDIKENEWFFDFVADFVDRKIIEGYPDGTFKPSASINRAEMAKIVSIFKGSILKKWDSQIFCDVPTSAWFYPYIMDLYYKNIASGFVGGDCNTNREFKASKELTRAEAIKIIMSLFEVEILPLSVNENTGFSDINSGHWVSPYVKKAFELGIIQGFEDGTFRPEISVNRVEFIKMLAEAESKLGN